MFERKYLSQDNIINYKNYKYASEDNTFFTRIYNVAWKKMVLLIPNYIHPNLITLMGFLSVILGYLMRNFKYGHFYMGIATFLYMNFDALDGMHARRIKQTSVIGEYFDHLIDLCNAGLISISLMEQFGITSLLTKNILFLGFGLIFMIPHYEAIYTKKIIFKGVTDVSLYLTTTILIFILDIKLPNFDYKDLILRMLGMSLVLYGINWLYKINLNNLSHTNKVEFKLPLLILLYYLVKGICLIMKPNENLYLIGISDTLLLLEITNYKIFKTDPTNILVLFPIIYSVNPVISTVYSVYNVIQFIIGLSNQLDINLFKVREKKLKVFCCGVFDMCHLGHMMLFKKIHDYYKNLGEPFELIVGIHSDKVCSSYKRSPIINENLRYKTVELCKHVDKIITDCPLVITKNYIEENNFDIVIIGEEYRNNKDIDWYPGAFELSNYHYISRCDEISTSEIIKKITSNY